MGCRQGRTMNPQKRSSFLRRKLLREHKLRVAFTDRNLPLMNAISSKKSGSSTIIGTFRTCPHSFQQFILNKRLLCRCIFFCLSLIIHLLYRLRNRQRNLDCRSVACFAFDLDAVIGAEQQLNPCMYIVDPDPGQVVFFLLIDLLHC